MPTPIREQIAAAVKTALSGIAGVTVYRNRTKEVPENAMPALVLVDGGHDSDQTQSPGHTAYALELTVEGYAKAADDDAIGPALNDLYGKLLAAVMADTTLGGLAIDIREGGMTMDSDRGDGRASLGGFALTLYVDFWTSTGDPYTAAP